MKSNSFFSKGTLSKFDIFLISGIIITGLAYSLLANEFDLLGFIASVTGLLCVVLCAKRSLSNYLFGIINVSLYAVISYKSQLYGDAALNALYYLPMNFIGWWNWLRHNGGKNKDGEDDRALVRSIRMSGVQRILLFSVSLALVLLTGLLLDRFTADPQPYKDAFTTVLSVISMFLMVKTYMEQWVLWIAVNAVSVIMWAVIFLKGGEHSALMVIMWLFYLINSVNGFIVWKRNS